MNSLKNGIWSLVLWVSLSLHPAITSAQENTNQSVKNITQSENISYNERVNIIDSAIGKIIRVFDPNDINQVDYISDLQHLATTIQTHNSFLSVPMRKRNEPLIWDAYTTILNYSSDVLNTIEKYLKTEGRNKWEVDTIKIMNIVNIITDTFNNHYDNADKTAIHISKDQALKKIEELQSLYNQLSK